MTNVLRATISGSYFAGDKQIESFEKVTGVLPGLNEDKAQQMLITRYAPIWIAQTMLKDENGKDTEEQKYKRVQRVRQVFVDSVEYAEDLAGKELSYVGKNILDMNFEELQDLAAAKDLSAIPLYKSGSLAQARRIAFAEYANKVLGWTELDAKGQEGPINFRKEGYNPNKYPEIIADGEIRVDGDAPASIEESIDREALILANKAKASSNPSKLTLAQLKSIADSKKIQYHPSIGYDALYKKVYKDEVAA